MFLDLPLDVTRSVTQFRLRVHTLYYETATWNLMSSTMCNRCKANVNVQDKCYVVFQCTHPPLCRRFAPFFNQTVSYDVCAFLNQNNNKLPFFLNYLRMNYLLFLSRLAVALLDWRSYPCKPFETLYVGSFCGIAVRGRVRIWLLQQVSLYTQKMAHLYAVECAGGRATTSISNLSCLLCHQPDSQIHMLSGCQNASIQNMVTERHNIASRLIIKTFWTKAILEETSFLQVLEVKHGWLNKVWSCLHI